MRKNNHRSIPTTEVKSRVKMWRSGKNWVYGLLFFFGMAGVSFGQAHLVHADTTELSTETQKGTIASQLTDRAVPLQTSMSQSAADSTNTAISDSEADPSKTSADQTVEASTTDTTSADATDTTATDSEPSTAGDKTESETTESPVSDPVNLSTTDSTDTTGATNQADSSTATKSDAAPVAKQTDSDTESSTSNETAETTNTDETADTVTPTTDQTDSSATLETSTTSETPVSDDSTAPVTEAASSSVDTSNTPLPAVSYKSLLSSSQVNALSQTQTLSSTNSAAGVAADIPAFTSSNGVLPEEFTVTDPDYPAGAFANDEASGLYSFFEGTRSGVKVVLSTDRATATHIYVQKVSGGTASEPVELAENQKYKGVSGFTIIDSGPDIDSVYVLPDTGATMAINYEIYSYRTGSNGTWSGFAVLKPLLQTQTTRYLDQAGNEIADSVEMKGLSGQNYTTGTPASLSGYTTPDTSNASGFMSPFSYDGQQFNEQLYKNGAEWGVLTYTVKDVKAGTMEVSFSGGGLEPTTLTYVPKGEPIKEGEVTYTAIGNYNIPNIYIPQTDHVDYNYQADSANVDVSFVDENGNSLTPDDPTNSTLTMLFNEATTISPAAITGYTYNAGYQPTAEDDQTATHNPETYTVTDIDNPGKIILHYTANDETVTVNHVDANNHPIGTVTEITGKYNDTLTVDEDTDANWTIEGYQAKGPVSHTFSDEKGQTVTVHYDQTATAKLKYVVDHADGTTTDLDAAQLGLQAQLTGVVGTSVVIDSPDITGYTAVSPTQTNYTFDEEDPDVILHYTANEVGVEVDFVDSQTGETVSAPITQTVNAGAAVQIKLAGADRIPVPGYVFPQKKVPNGGDLDILADGSIVINMTAPADGVGKATVYLDPTKTVDATDKPTSETDNSNEYQIYRLTNRVVTIKTTTPDGSDFAATNGTQTVTYKRQYTYDVYIGPNSALTFGEWKVSGDDLAAITSASPDGYTKTITLSTNSGTPVTMTGDGAVNDQIQKDLTALLSLPKNGMLPNETTEAINVTYTAAEHQLTVHFINKADNSDIQTQTFEGLTNGPIDFSTLKDTNGQTLDKAVEGYVLVDDQTTGLTTFAATDPQDANLYYTPITGQFSVALPNASTPTEIPYANDPADPYSVSEGKTPVISGYTAYIDGPDGPVNLATTDDGNYIIPAPTDPTSTTTVKFRENDVIVTVTVKFLDMTDYKNVLKADQIFSGANNTKIDYSHDEDGNALDRYVEGYLLMWDSTVTTPDYDKSDPKKLEPAILYRPVDNFTYQTPDDQPTTTSYQTDPNNPSKEIGTIPYVEGFTPNSTTETFTPVQGPDGTITGYTFEPSAPAAVGTIQYRADSQKMLVHFKNTDNETIADDVTVTGASESTIDYDKVAKTIDGYVYDADASALTNPLDSDDGTTQEATLIYKASGDYTYTTPGTDTPTTTTYTTDPDDPSAVTGHVPYTPGYTPQINGKDIPLIDLADPSKGYDFTPDDPTDSTTITYAANDQKLTVHFKNTDNETIAADVTVTGASDSTIDYDKVAKTIDGYVYDADASTLTNPLDTEDDTDQEATLIYKASGDYTYTTPGTDTPTTTTYTTDPEDPSAVTGHVPYTPGYTPQINGKNIPLSDLTDPNKGYNFTPEPPTQSTTITYAANEQNLTVHFKNTDNETIAADVNVTGESKSTIDYDTIAKSIDVYVYDADASELTNPLDTDDDTDQEATLIYKASGKYTYTTPDDETPITATYTTNPDDPSAVTGHVPYTPGFTPQINGKDIPLIDKGNPNKGYEFTPADPTQPTTITYAANDQKLTVHFKNTDNETIAADVTVTGESKSTIDYDTIAKSIDGYVYDADASELTNPLDTDDDVTQEATLIYKASGDYTYTTPGIDTPTTTTYTTDPEDPSAVTGHVPYTPGFTPQINDEDIPLIDPADPNKGYSFTPEDPTDSTTITYAANDQKLTVHFKNTDNETIAADVTVTGESASTIDYDTIAKSIDGYVYDADASELTNPLDNIDDTDQEATLIYKASGDYTYTTPGTDTPTTTTYTTDPDDPSVATGHIPYTPGFTPQINGKGIPLIDKDNPNKGYDFTPADPTQPTTITYAANDQKLTVHFETADGAEISGTATLTGGSGSTVDYSTLNKQLTGYILTTDGTLTTTRFDTDDKQDQSVILTYALLGDGVTVTTPTGEKTTTPYTNDSTEPNDPKTVDPITIAYVPGYTPSSDNGDVTPIKDPEGQITSYTLIPDDPTQSTTVTYNADDKSFIVKFVDESDLNTALKPEQTLSGVTDGEIDYTTVEKVIDGYVLITDPTIGKTKFAATDNGETLTLVYQQIGNGVTLTTPDPDDPDGQQTTKPYTNDPTDPSTVLPIDVPYIPGYTPSTPETVGKVEPKDPDDLTKGYTFTPKEPAQPAIVTYNADSKNVNVVFVDQADPETLLKPTQNLSGVTDGDIDYTSVEKVIDGYVLLTDETVGKTKFTATDNGEKLTLTYQKTAGGYVGKTPAGVDLTTPYVTDPEDPKTVQPITIPTVPGYTLDTENGKRTPVDDNDPSKGYTVTPIDPSQPTTVTYTAEAGKSVQVAYVDEHGVEIAGHPVKTLSGQTDQTIDYGTKAIAGYVLTTDGTKDKTTFAATDDGTRLTISYEKIVVTITKPTDDGNTETVPVDTTTPGHVDYIPGYTPKTDDGTALEPVDPGDKTKGYTVPVPDDPTTPTTINYDPDMQTAQVILIDTAGNPVTNDEGQSTYTFHGVTGQGIHEWEVDKKAAAYTISEDGTLQQFVYDNVDGNVQVVKVIYLKTSAFNDPDGGTTTLLTDGNGTVVSIDKKWGTDGGDTNVLIENGVVTLTPNTDDTPIVLTTGVPDGDGTVTGMHGNDGNIILTQKTPDGVITETITPDGQLSFSQVPTAVSPTPETFFNTQITHDPDGGTTTTKTNGHGDITAIDRNWPDGDHSHVDIDTGTGIAKITETPAGGNPSEPVDVQPGTTATVGKTTLDNHDPINLTHAGTDGDGTIATITPDGKRTFTYTHTTDDPDGGTTTTKTNGTGDITTIDRNWPDGDHSHVDIDTGTGIATITETPNGGSPNEPIAVQPGTTATVGKTTLDNHDPINLTHAGTDGDSTIATITPDGKRTFTYTHTTDDPDGGKTTTTTNTNGKITTIDKDWADGDHSHVDIDTGTGVATITETPAGGSPSEPITLQPGESGKSGKTTLDNGQPDGNIVLTHRGTDGDKTIETITPDTSRSFSRQPGGVSTTAKDYYETQITHDPDGGTTTTKTNGDDDITTIDKDWSDGDHSHVDIDTDTGIATITETPKGGSPSEPITVQPGESGKNGKTTLDNGKPDGNIVLTHQGTDGDKTTETITPDTSRSFSRQPGGVQTTGKDYFETQITHDPDGGTTTTKTNGDGDITTIDKDWGDGDHSHVDIDTDTGIAKITETPNGGEAGTPVEVQPGGSGKNGKTTLDNGEPDGNIVLTHQGTDGDKTTETITPDTSRSFSRQPGGVQTTGKDYFETQITHDPDGGTTTTKTNGDGDITTIDKDWGDGDHSHVDIDTDTGIATITETPNGGEAGTPVEVQPGESGKNGKTTLDNGEPDGNIVLTHQGTDGDKTIETITPDTSRSFSRQPGGVSTTAKNYYETQITHDPDGGTTTTKTNGDGDITTIDKDWSDGDHSHVDIDTDTGIAKITETPNGGEAGTPVEVQPGGSGKNGKTTLDNGEPDDNIVLTHQETDGDKTTETITPDTSRSFSRQPGGVSTTAKDYFETQITHDPDGGTTTTKTNGDGDITTIDKDWGDGDHSHVDIDTDTGIATITETPKGGIPSEPITVQPGESGKNGKTTLDNGEPDGNIVLTHQGTDGDKTTETITPDTSRSFSRQPGGVQTTGKDYFETQITHDPDGGTTTTKTNGDGDITTIDKDWSDGDHSHVDIDTGTGIATITETPAGGSPSEPITVQPGESGKNDKTTLDNGEPDGNIVLTHQGTDGDKTTETITPDTSRSFSRQPGGVSTTAKDYYETQITHDPDGGTTTTKTNGDGDITTIDKDWSDGDHSHVDIDTDTGIATITETPKGGSPSEPITVQPGESGKNGKTTLDNGEPDGNIVLTHQGTDGDKTTETITPDTSRSFSRQPGGVSTDASHYFETQVTHDPDGGTTATKTNGDGDITTIDKDWGDGDHSHVDIDTGTGIAKITETPAGGSPSEPITVQPGESGKNGKTTLDNGEPDGNIGLTHQGADGDKTTETITPDTSRSFSRQPGGVSTTLKDYFETQITHDPDGGTTTTKTNGDGDITTIDKDWGDGDHSHVDIDTDTGIATITETPNGGEAGTPVEVQPGESGKNGKTTLDNGEPDGNIVLTHQGTDGDKTIETITPDTSRSFSRMPTPVFVTADDYYDTRITHDSDGGTTTTVTNGNGDVTTIDKDWGDGSHTHVTVDPNAGDATATDTDENGNTSTPVTVKPGETGTTGQTTITNGQPDGDIILSHEGTDGDQVEAAISDDGHVRVSLPDTDAEAKAETNVAVTSASGSITSANHANLPQTSATSRTDVQDKKSTTTQLPETGDKQNGLGLIGATLLAGLAMLGFGKRRRDDED